MKNRSVFSVRKINEENLGDFLFFRRRNLGLSLEEISQKISISKEYLKALEKNDFKSLPPDIYIRGFINRYTDFLKIDRNKAIFLYEKRRLKKREDVSYFRPFNSYSQFLRFLNYRNFIFFLGVGTSVVLFFYLIKIISPLYTNPTFEILFPENCPFETEKEKLEIKGQVQPEGLLLINGEEVLIDKEGFFSSVVILKTGENQIHFKIKNKFQKEREENCEIRKVE